MGEPSLDWLGVPLQVADQTLGVLVVQTYSEGARYTEDDMRMLSFVSSQIAMAIDRTQKEESLRASEAEMRSLFSAMSDIVLLVDADGRYLKIPHQSRIAVHAVRPVDRQDRSGGVLPAELFRATFAKRLPAEPQKEDICCGSTGGISGRCYHLCGDDKVLIVARDRTAQKAMRKQEAERTKRDLSTRSWIAAYTHRYVSANPVSRIFGYDSPDELLAEMARDEGQLYVNPGRRYTLPSSFS
jgi:hypothetical protein